MTTERRVTPEIIDKNLKALFIGMNPGLASARRGHNFAGRGNSFWRLMHESGILPRKLKPEQEPELLRYGFGLTNLIRRPTAGVMDLQREDYEKGRIELASTIETYRPRSLVFVGLMVYREFLGKRGRKIAQCGEIPATICDARVFVVPNPSGRNAHFSYEQMLTHFQSVAQALAEMDANAK